MSESWIDTIQLYRAERFPLRIFAPVALTLTAAASTNGSPRPLLEVFLSFITSALLLLQFRVWDDIQDRDYDRLRHPNRILPRCAHLWPFYLCVAWSGLLIALLLSLIGGSVTAFVLTCAAASIWYAAVPHAWRSKIWGRHVLLLKYPAFVWVIAPPRSHTIELLSSAVIVYLCSGIYELVHDRELRSRRAARFLVAVEVGVLGVIAAVIFNTLGGSL